MFETLSDRFDGIFSRVRGRGKLTEADVDDVLREIRLALLEADVNLDVAKNLVGRIRERAVGEELSKALNPGQQVVKIVLEELTTSLGGEAMKITYASKPPTVVLMAGLQGAGKTTNTGKLAQWFKKQGRNPLLVGADLQRPAAVEQLQVWGDRAGVPVLTAPEGSDPASLAFDAMGKAQDEGADILLIDTAGRLQNRSDLMDELEKIVRVIRKKDETAPHNTLLVLDATTGQNALSQVEVFQKISDVSGLVMTKLDGTAKGGVLVALADRFGLPIHAIGVGEQIDDLQPFDPDEFAEALTGARA